MSPDRAILHAILAQGAPALFVAIKYGIGPEHLFDENRSVYAFIQDFLPKGRMPSVDEIAIATGAQLDPTIDGTKIDAETCAKALVKRALGKQISSGLKEVLDMLKSDPHGARTLLSTLVEESTWSVGKFPTIPDATTVEDLRDLYITAEKRRGQLLGWGSPWPTMDKSSLGLQKGELTVLFAKKKLGKTFCKLAWIEHIWNKEMTPDDRILFVSMEMQPRLVYRRFGAVHLKFDYELFRSGNLPTFQRDRFMKWCDDLKDGNLQKPKLTVISSTESPSVNALCPIIAQLKPKLVVIDSFYMLQNKGDGQWEKVLRNVQDLKIKVANAFDIPVLVSTQLKGTVKRDVVDADTDDAAYAKAIGDYADASRGLFGTIQHVEEQRRVWRGLESREFKPVDLLINFNMNTMDFSEIQELKPGDLDPDKKEDDEDGDKPKDDDKPKGPRKGPKKRPLPEDDDGPILSI